MIFRRFLLLITLIAALPTPALFGAGEVAGGHAAEEHAEHHALPPNAVVLTEIGPFAITNSMVVTWIVAIGLIVIAQLATKNAKVIPSGLQNFVEWLVESLFAFFEGVLGERMTKQTFWFFGTIFIFILFTNWFGLIPGLGTIGWGHATEHGFVTTEPLLRGVNADLNMTSAMALFFFALWIYWSLKEIGVGGFFFHIFNIKGPGVTAMGLFLMVIYLFVGVIEVVSIGVRPGRVSYLRPSMPNFANSVSTSSLARTLIDAISSIA